MNTRLNIANFRVFDENGVEFELNPITILTGSNSSGKSTVVKALLLLQDFCLQLRSDYEEGRQLRLENYKMDFHKQPNSILGSFELVRHHKKNADDELTDNNQFITIEVVVKSYWLLQDVILHLEFESLNWDQLDNGYLHAYSIRTIDGKVIYSAVRGGKSSMDFSVIKQSFLYFLYGQHGFAKWQEEINNCRAFGDDPSKSASEELENTWNNLYKMGPEAPISVFQWQVSHCEQEWKGGSHYSARSLIEEHNQADINKVNLSFTRNSSALNVYCYYPCFEILKDIKKEDLRDFINQQIKTHEFDTSQEVELPRLGDYDCRSALNVLNDFMDLFENSGTESLHEFISLVEDELFFADPDIYVFGGKEDKFAFPNCMLPMMSSQVHSHYTNHWFLILEAMNLINQITTQSGTRYIHLNEPNNSEHYFMENALRDYFRQIIEEIFVELVPGTLSYSSTTIIYPQRMYSLEDNSEFSNTLKSYFDAKRYTEKPAENESVWDRLARKNKRKIPYESGSFMNKWLKALDIAHHVEIESHADGFGATIRLFEDEDDKKGMLLADKGIGILQVISILLKIETAIVQSQMNDLLNPNKTDGFSDGAIELLSTYSQLHPITVALEEPESHLHPKYQSLLADMFLEAYENYGIHFIIETHSEYLIRKAQVLVARAKYEDINELEEENPFKVYYVSTGEKKPYQMEFRTDGKFSNEFGTGFFDEATNQLFEIL